MNNEEALRQTTTNKRVRFESDPSIQVLSSTSTSPVKAAMESVKAFLQTLHPSLAPVAKDIGEHHVSLFKNLHRKNKSFNKLQDDLESIPQSVNVLTNFKLRASKTTEDSAEFTSVS